MYYKRRLKNHCRAKRRKTKPTVYIKLAILLKQQGLNYVSQNKYLLR